MEDCSYGINIDNNIVNDITKSSIDISTMEEGLDYNGSDVKHISTAKCMAERLYKFQSDLVKEGQAFINDLRCSNVHPDLTINIVVLV